MPWGRQRLGVRGIIAPRQQAPPWDRRVERLDPAVEDLGKAGHVSDRRRRDTRVLQLPQRPPRSR